MHRRTKEIDGKKTHLSHGALMQPGRNCKVKFFKVDKTRNSNIIKKGYLENFSLNKAVFLEPSVLTLGSQYERGCNFA